jgi:hypothetical protein
MPDELGCNFLNPEAEVTVDLPKLGKPRQVVQVDTIGAAMGGADLAFPACGSTLA